MTFATVTRLPAPGPGAGPSLHVRLFGRFDVVTDRGPLQGLESRKVQELLSYLLLAGQRPSHRDLLAEQLWPNCHSQHSRKYLRQALWKLQRVLDVNGFDGLLRADQDWIQLYGYDALWVDAIELERVYERFCGGSADDEDDDDAMAEMQRAAQLYWAPLLEGWYQDWCLAARDSCRTMYLALLDRLMVLSETRGLWELGLACGRRALREDRANERAHVRMMRLHYLAGNRTAALRQFALCTAALEKDLGVAPAGDTRRLHEQIRDGGSVCAEEHVGRLVAAASVVGGV